MINPGPVDAKQSTQSHITPVTKKSADKPDSIEFLASSEPAQMGGFSTEAFLDSSLLLDLHAGRHRFGPHDFAAGNHLFVAIDP